MVCQSCGSELAAEVRFCAKCGAQVVAAAPQPQQPLYGAPQYPAYPQQYPIVVAPRVQRHLQTLGMLWCVYALYHVVKGLIGITFLHAFSTHAFFGNWPDWSYYHGPSPAPWMQAMVPVIATITAVWVVATLLVGYSLLTRKPWGRVLAIVIAILSIIHLPIGTALGIYTLWVLAPSASGLEYDAIADRT